MTALGEQVLAEIEKEPGLTDRELTDRLRGASAPQQAVNQAARKLELQGRLERRKRSDGKIGSYPAGLRASTPAKEPTGERPVASLDLGGCVDSFFSDVGQGAIELYNEFSLQHELGVRLRLALSDYRVQFERPVDFFGIRRLDTVKKEIDISVFQPDGGEKYALELKFPRNGQHPEQMFSACQDIAFLEDLVRAGFTAGLFVMVVEDPLFYRGASDSLPYAYFRGGEPIHGVVRKPTGERDKVLEISGSYQIVWKTAGPYRYAYVRVGQV